MIKIDRKKLEEIRDYIGWEEPDRQGTDLCEYLELLINPAPPPPEMTKADWQRVVDEKFYVSFECSNRLVPLTSIGYNGISFVFYYNDDQEYSYDCEVVREKGIRQPHFQGHPHPDGKVLVEVYYDDDKTPYRMCADAVFWTSVTEYILL